MKKVEGREEEGSAGKAEEGREGKRGEEERG